MNHPFVEEDIIRFIRNELTGEERNVFDKELNSNQSLVDEVRRVKLSISAIDIGGEQLLKQRFKKLEKRNAVKKWIYILLVAISLIAIGLIIKKGISKEKPLEMKVIYANNYQKYRPPVSIRNGENPSFDKSAAIEAYNIPEYEKAFRLFNAECSESNQEACFYAVLSALYDGDINYQRAKNNLVENPPYSAIVLWYEALFYLHENNKDEAIGNLEKLSELGIYKMDESLEILEKLRQ